MECLPVGGVRGYVCINGADERAAVTLACRSELVCAAGEQRLRAGTAAVNAVMPYSHSDLRSDVQARALVIVWNDQDFAVGLRLELTVRVDDPIQREAARDDRGQPSLRGKRQRLRDERAHLLMTDKARSGPYFVTKTEPASIK
jgi:hypothetical protein